MSKKKKPKPMFATVVEHNYDYVSGKIITTKVSAKVTLNGDIITIHEVVK